MLALDPHAGLPTPAGLEAVVVALDPWEATPRAAQRTGYALFQAMEVQVSSTTSQGFPLHTQQEVVVVPAPAVQVVLEAVLGQEASVLLAIHQHQDQAQLQDQGGGAVGLLQVLQTA